MLRLALVVMLVGLVPAGLSAQSPAATEGWPQWGGPDRDFKVVSGTVADRWSADGPPELWRRPLGEGYSAIVVEGDTLVTMYRDADAEVVIALDAASGDTLWQHAYHAPLLNNGYFDVWLNSAGPGPYATPLIADDLVIAVGVNGHLHAFDLQTGVVRWSHDLVERFDLSEYNAFASSPLAYGRTLILPLGGSADGVVALDRETGAVAWRSEPFPLAPGSPLVVNVDGSDQLVVLGQQDVVGLDPTDGRRLWSHPHPNQLGLNVPMPVWGPDNRLFVTSGYDSGSRMLRLEAADGATVVEEEWHTNRMRVHFSNALRVGELIVGSSGDFGPAFLTALDVETGEEVWRERSFARAHLVATGDRVIVVDEDGEIAIVVMTPDGIDVQARHAVLSENAWTPPTLVGGTLYVRDRRDIVALDLGTGGSGSDPN